MSGLRVMSGAFVVTLGFCFAWAWQQRWEPIAAAVVFHLWGVWAYYLGATFGGDR